MLEELGCDPGAKRFRKQKDEGQRDREREIDASTEILR